MTLDPFQFFQNEDRAMYRIIDLFQTALERWKPSGDLFAQPLEQIRKSLHYFETHMRVHMEQEETLLFPFFEKHLPRLESVVFVLLAEHETFRQILKQLSAWGDTLTEQKTCPTILYSKIKTQGLYLAVLLKTHIWAEDQGIYKPAQEALNSREKESLGHFLKKRVPRFAEVSSMAKHRPSLESWYCSCDRVPPAKAACDIRHSRHQGLDLK